MHDAEPGYTSHHPGELLHQISTHCPGKHTCICQILYPDLGLGKWSNCICGLIMALCSKNTLYVKWLLHQAYLGPICFHQHEQPALKKGLAIAEPPAQTIRGECVGIGMLMCFPNWNLSRRSHFQDSCEPVAGSLQASRP